MTRNQGCRQQQMMVPSLKMSTVSDRQSEVFSDRENMAAGGALLWQNNNRVRAWGGVPAT